MLQVYEDRYTKGVAGIKVAEVRWKSQRMEILLMKAKARVMQEK